MYKNEFQKLIEDCAQKYALKGKTVPSYSTYEDFDYQTSILFSIGKHPEKERITQEVMEYIKASGNYEKFELTGNGYVSVKVKTKAFTDGTKFNNTLFEAPTKPKKIVIDYCGANVAKKMHIGHIRSMFIGDFITRLQKAKQNEVYIFNHIGDWGNQFGFLLQYIIDNKIEVTSNQQLTDIYKAASALNEQDEAFRKTAEARAYMLQQGDNETVAVWQKCREISLVEMDKTFKDFHLLMTSDSAYGESFYAPMCPAVEKLLIEAGVATVCEDGSVIVPDENPKKSPLVIKKSTGSYLYAMYDLAAIHYRVTNINPDEIIYVVDKRQELHFKQVFAAANKMGWADKCKLQHIGFGTILGADKKPLKTRSGESLYLDDLIEQGLDEMKTHPAIDKLPDGEYKQEVLNTTLYGSLKFYDLHFATHTDYLFSWESVLNTKGNSAPYIQNAIARIDSIFFNLGDPQNDVFKLDLNSFVNAGNTSDDKDVKAMLNLLMKAQQSHEIFKTVEANDSQFLTEAVVNLCKNFHQFYEQVNISKLIGDKQEFAIAVLVYITSLIKKASNVLGIGLYVCEKRAQLFE